MKHIVFFTPSLNIGGIERVFLTYASALSSLGYKVTYLVSHENGELEALLPEGVRLQSLGNKRLHQSLLPFIRFFRKTTADVFITGGDIPNSLSILAHAMTRSKTKIIISHHNYFNVEGNVLLQKLLIRLLYNRAFMIISVSKGITELLQSRRVNPKKIATIYNPIDTEYIRYCSQKNTDLPLPSRFFLFLGRLSRVKNLPFLIDAFKILSEKDPTLELLLLGEGPMRDLLNPMIRKNKLEEKVHLVGAVDNPFIILKKALAVVLPSTSEALPTVILESFVLGKTVVATPTIGARDLLVNGTFGYLSNSFNDSNEFALLMEKALKEPVPKQRLYIRSTIYDVKTIVQQLVTLIEDE
jgi:glycosyltransferase involved in cell wall biosynthesis